MLHRIVAILSLAGMAATLAAQSNVSFETFNDPNHTATGGMVAGDFNNDGKPDLVQCCNSSTQMVFREGNGDGTFQAPTVAFATPVSLASPVAVDVNGDGKLDIVAIAALNPPAPPREGAYYLIVLLGNGDRTFQAPKTYTTTYARNTLVVGSCSRYFRWAPAHRAKNRRPRCAAYYSRNCARLIIRKTGLFRRARLWRG
ncbi:MAG TPA: VCBS repeat-containing protein [Acidobacteriaceae bacterium]|nr:VCBS repeat-containing protein [Acidobacteriaceae bacterium]